MKPRRREEVARTGIRTAARSPPIGLSRRSVMSPPCAANAMSRAIASQPGAALVLVAGVVEPQERLEHFLAHVAGMPGPSSSTVTVNNGDRGGR
jgi:hypothetical protein